MNNYSNSHYQNNIDLESELRGITRVNTECSSCKWNKGSEHCSCNRNKCICKDNKKLMNKMKGCQCYLRK